MSYKLIRLEVRTRNNSWALYAREETLPWESEWQLIVESENSSMITFIYEFLHRKSGIDLTSIDQVHEIVSQIFEGLRKIQKKYRVIQ